MIVLDASFVMKLLTREISIDIFDPEEKFIAPELFDYEITNIFWKLAKVRDLSISAVRNFLATVRSLGIERQKPDMMKIFMFASETGLTAYDASYLSLAKEFDCPIATFDKEIIKIANQLGIEVVKTD